MSCKVFDYRLIKLRCCGRGLLYKVGSNEHLTKRNVSKDAFHSSVRKGVFSSNQFKVGHFGLHKVRTTALPIDVSRGYEESIPQYAIHSDSPDALRYEGGGAGVSSPLRRGFTTSAVSGHASRKGRLMRRRSSERDIGGVRFRKCAAHHG